MITPIGFNYKKFKYPVGELQVALSDCQPKVSIEWEYENNEELIELLMVVDCLKQKHIDIKDLFLPYVPFSRQDRSNAVGECFSLKVFCGIINSIGAETVSIIDPHSDVTTALLNNVQVKQQYEVFADLLRDKTGYLISPDGGALKKIYKLAKLVNMEVIECSKIRNVSTGDITGVKVHGVEDLITHQTCYIVDDICDGGRTFIEIAKVLKHAMIDKIVLLVTHGFFTKGMEVFTDINEIYTRKGRAK